MNYIERFNVDVDEEKDCLMIKDNQGILKSSTGDESVKLAPYNDAKVVMQYLMIQEELIRVLISELKDNNYDKETIKEVLVDCADVPFELSDFVECYLG